MGLRIHLQEAPERDATDMVREAIHNFFSYRDQLTSLEFRRIMGEGRVSLVIGLTFLFLPARADLPAARRQHLPVIPAREPDHRRGWVAMSQPLQDLSVRSGGRWRRRQPGVRPKLQPDPGRSRCPGPQRRLIRPSRWGWPGDAGGGWISRCGEGAGREAA